LDVSIPKWCDSKLIIEGYAATFGNGFNSKVVRFKEYRR